MKIYLRAADSVEHSLARSLAYSLSLLVAGTTLYRSCCTSSSGLGSLKLQLQHLLGGALFVAPARLPGGAVSGRRGRSGWREEIAAHREWRCGAAMAPIPRHSNEGDGGALIPSAPRYVIR